MRGHLGPRDLCLNKQGNGPLSMQCCISNFKHLSKLDLKKIFEYFSIYFYGSNLGPCGLYLSNLGKIPLGYGTYQISSFLSGSEEDF